MNDEREGHGSAGPGAAETMDAVVIREPGGPEVLALDSVPRPVPGRGEIRVRVHASGVNRADLLQRRGLYPAPAGVPEDVPGLEFAGVVEALGPGTGRWEPGDPVMGIVGGGGYAPYVVVPERVAVRVPEGASLEEAGAIPEVFLTAFDALFLQGGLGAGETVLVHAVGSGVGTAALQLAMRAGARVIGTSRTEEKLERARAVGLEVAVRGEEGWPDAVLEATGGQGADVILDLVGAAYLQGNLRALARRGRHIVVGVPGGTRGEIDLRALMAKRALLRGTVLRSRPEEEKAVLAGIFEERVVPLFERNALAPVVDRTFPPDRASEAHRLLEENRTFGKILLLW